MGAHDDILYDAARSYSKLIGTKLEFVLGKKGKLQRLIIVFDSTGFYHLAGLHKLKDIQVIKGISSSKILKNILNGIITAKMIEKSSFYHVVKERLNIISEFPNALKDNSIVWKFNRLRINKGSKINWDYLIEYGEKPQITYLFLRLSNSNATKYSCISTFRKKERDYTRLQIRMTVLKITFTDRQNKNVIIYQRLGFNDR